MTGVTPNPTPIYRLIHLDNLDVLLRRQVLHSPNHAPDDGLHYRTIHRQDVQESRRVRNVHRGPGGTAHDYFGFYFGPRSVMLFQLKTGRVEGYGDGQAPLIYLTTTCQAVANAGAGFVFTDGHALAKFTAWYDDLADLHKIDWDAAYATWWNDTPEDMDRQRRKQAEFLVHQSMSWSLINGVGVYNEAARLRVEAELAARGLGGTVPVQVRSEWYY
jgi:ssDNA thymidine ADP-ribosyltransferase, DarT